MGIFMFITIGIIIWYCVESKKINDVKRACNNAKKRNDGLFRDGFFIDDKGFMRDAKTFEICHRRYGTEDFVVVYSKSGKVRNITSEQELVKFRNIQANYKEGDDVSACIYKERQRHQNEHITGVVGVRYADLKTKNGTLMVVRKIDDDRYYMGVTSGLLIRPTDGQRWYDKNVAKDFPRNKDNPLFLEEKNKKYEETIKLFNETQMKRKGKVHNSDYYYNYLGYDDWKMEKHINDYFEEKRKREIEGGA